jgi:hypothetical protein
LLNEARGFISTSLTDKQSRHLIAKKEIYTPEAGASRPRVAKHKANPPVKRKSQFEDYRLTTPKRLIRPQSLGILSPCGSQEPYRPGVINRKQASERNLRYHRNLDTINEPDYTVYRNKPNSELSTEGSSPELTLFFDAQPFQELYIAQGIEQIRLRTPDSTHTLSPDLENAGENIHILQDFGAALDLEDSDPEEELLILNDPDLELIADINPQQIMDPPVNDLPGIIGHLQGANNDERRNAIVQLAQYVQRLNAPAQAQQAPARLTLREALENQRAGAADNLKVTDLMPDSWGSIKDGDPESHCLRFESYANVHGYENDQSRITWFQATLKGEALNWLTAENNYATWEELRRAFIAEFENQPSRNVAIGNFRKITWNGSERASTYLQKLKKAARMIEADDAEIMVQFEMGLPKAVKLFFGATNPTTLKDMTQTLQKYLELHGPVTISTTGASQALNTIAEVLTGGTSNPFMHNQMCPSAVQTMPQANSDDTATALRYMAQQNSMLTTMIAEEKVEAKAERYRRPDKDKKVRFEDKHRKYQSPSGRHRNNYSSAESEGSGADTTENEADSDHEHKHVRRHQGERQNKYDKYKDRRDNSSRSHRSRRESQYDITDQMTKMMPVVAAMADITQGTLCPRDQYGQNTDTNRQNRQSYPNFEPHYNQGQPPRGGQFNNRGGQGNTSYATRGRGGSFQQNRSRGDTGTLPPGDGKCFYCGTYGHYKRDCRKLSWNNRNRQPDRRYDGQNNQGPQDARMARGGNFV